MTLVELLVTLVVLGFVSAIVSQAMRNFLRIDELLASRALPSQAQAVRIDWVRQALAALEPPDASGHGGVTGTARTLGGMSGNPLADGPAGYGRIDLSLTFDAATGETALLAKFIGRPDPVELLRWSGDIGRFDYYDSAGNRMDTWPPVMGLKEPVPAEIVLETGLDSPAIIAAAPLTTGEKQLSRRDVEQL